MPQPQTITTMDPKLIMRELDELDRVVHRLRTRLAVPLPQRMAGPHSHSAWNTTHGVMGRERGNKMMKHLIQSRRKDAQRIAVLLSLSTHHK